MAVHQISRSTMSLLLLLLVLQFWSSRLSNADGQQQRSYVMDLTADTLAPAIEKYEVIMVEFYAPWCGHCKHLAPEYEKASQMLFHEASHVKLAKIDADKYGSIASKYDIGGYPTLRLYTNGIPTETEYNGRRTAEAIVSYVKRSIIPAITTLATESELTWFVKNGSDNSPVFIGFGLETSLLEELARKHRRKALFAVINDFSEKVMIDFDFDKRPAFIALHPKVEEQAVFYGPFEDSDIGDFILQHLMPSVSSIDNYETVKRLKEDGRPIAVGIVDIISDGTARSFVQKLKAAAPANRAFVFAYVETTNSLAFVEPFGIGKASVLPTVIIWDGEAHFSKNDDVEAFIGVDVEARLTTFLQDYRDGKLKLLSLVQPSLLLRAKTMLFGVPTLLFVILVVVLVLALRGCKWNELTGDGDYGDEYRERGRRTDLEGDIIGDRGPGDSADPLHFGRKSEKRD